MAKYFKSKKMLRSELLIKYVIIIVVSVFLIRAYINSLVNINPVNYLNTHTVFQGYYVKVKDITINNPVSLLNYRANNIPLSGRKTSPVIAVVPDTKKVYIYNTHQTEKYIGNKTVVDAAKYFKSELEKNNIGVDLELGNVQEFLTVNNYAYNYSYVASRYFIEEGIIQNNYNLIIDFHRDAVSKSSSTTTIAGKKYAKIMFVIGKKNKNYKQNYKVAEDLNKLVSAKYPNLTRGILLQSGNNVNGIYNQDINANMILIEFGGNNNTYEEVTNTLELIAPIIGEYLNEQKI